MCVKKIVTNFPWIVNGTMTGTATILSSPQNIQNIDNVGLQISWTGAAVGTISILGSIDGITYYPITFNPTLTQPNNNAGGYLVSLNQLPFSWLKFQYVNSSSTGTLNVALCQKDLN